MANKTEMTNVVKYLSYLQNSMDEGVRRREYKIASFSFNRVANDVKAMWDINHDDSLTLEEKEEEQATNPAFTNKNAVNVLNSAPSISPVVEGYVSRRSGILSTIASSLEPTEPNRHKDPCAYPDIIEKVYPLIKGEFSSDSDMPISWESFIDQYITSPKPYYEKLENDFTTKGLGEKLKITVGEYAEQKKLFDKISHPGDMEETQYTKTWKWYQKNKGSFFASGDDWYSKKNLENVRKRLLDTDNVVEKYKRLYNLVIDKICLNSLLRKAMECTLPPLECASLIRLLGPQTVLSFLKNIQTIDS